MIYVRFEKPELTTAHNDLIYALLILEHRQ